LHLLRLGDGILMDKASLMKKEGCMYVVLIGGLNASENSPRVEGARRFRFKKQ